MDVFISWSGIRSNAVAQALRESLPNFIHGIKPFMSQLDIDKGKRPLDEIEKHLGESGCGIVCITPENLSSQWLNFEGGGLSVKVAANVWTYLLGLKYKEVTGPLEQFQHTLANKADTLRLVISLHTRAKTGLSNAGIEKAFESNWPELETKLKAIPPLSAPACFGTILAPDNGFSATPEWLEMNGTVSSDEHTFWLVTKRGSEYWPHAPVSLDAKKAWRGKVNIDTRPGPRSVTVVLAWTSSEMHSILSSWKAKCHATNNWSPLTMTPPTQDFIVVDSRTVTIPAPKK